MKSRFLPRRGFTLVELLVVVAIIAALVTGAFGAFIFVIEKAKTAEAQSIARTVVNAVENFERDYDVLPQPVSTTRGSDCETDTTAPEGFVAILYGMDKVRNPRRANYLGDLKQATLTSGRLVNGLVHDGETLELVDPWGTPFKVTLDLDGDGKVSNPNPEDMANKELHHNVIAYSAGRDRDFGTWKDNVASWR